MQVILNCFLLILSSSLAENAVLVHGFCFNNMYPKTPSLYSVLDNCIYLLPVCIVAGFSGWLTSFLITNFLTLAMFWRPILYFICFLILYFIFQLCFRKIKSLQAYGEKFVDRYAIISFGFLPMGILFICGQGSYTLLNTIAFSIGSVFGFFAVSILFIYMQRWMKLSKISDKIAGFPLEMISLGFFSLAFFALLGHAAAL